MRNLTLVCLWSVVILLVGGLMNSGHAQKQEKEASVLRHVVFFKFNESATADKVSNLVAEFKKLPHLIKEVKDFEWGTDNSPEGLAKGFTHCFLVTFDSEEGRQIYLDHPDHVKFVEILKPLLEDVTVVDYWSKK